MRALAILFWIAGGAIVAGVVIIISGVISGAMWLARVGLWLCAGGALTITTLSALACCIVGAQSHTTREERLHNDNSYTIQDTARPR